jgi:hypothetical protein
MTSSTSAVIAGPDELVRVGVEGVVRLDLAPVSLLRTDLGSRLVRSHEQHATGGEPADERGRERFGSGELDRNQKRLRVVSRLSRYPRVGQPVGPLGPLGALGLEKLLFRFVGNAFCSASSEP